MWCPELSLAGLATGGAANYAKGATALNYIAKGACILDVAGNASQVGMGVNDVIETGSLSFSNTLQIVGGGFGLGGNFTGLMKGFGRTNDIYFNKTHSGSMPKPKGTGPNGGARQSHHGLQEEWATENLKAYGYKPSKAPTVTIETGKGFPHTLISNNQNLRRNARVLEGKGKWSSTLQEELSYIVDDFTEAGFSNKIIKKVMEQQYKMLDKLGVPYERIRF